MMAAIATATTMPRGMPTSGGRPKCAYGAHRGIGAAAEEHDMADRDLAGIAADDVPGRGRDRIEQHQRAEPLLERRREQQRIGDHQRQRHRWPEQAAHHDLPIRPCGRNQRKETNSA